MMLISLIVLPFLFRTGDKLILEKQNEIESRQQEVGIQVPLHLRTISKSRTASRFSINFFRLFGPRIPNVDCCSIDSSKAPTTNPTNIDLTLKKLNLPTPNGSLLDGRSPRGLLPQLQRLTEVERVVRVSTRNRFIS